MRFLYQHTILDCPCEANCPNGCDDCENPICKPIGNAILVLNTSYSSNKPFIVDFNG